MMLMIVCICCIPAGPVLLIYFRIRSMHPILSRTVLPNITSEISFQSAISLHPNLLLLPHHQEDNETSLALSLFCTGII